MTVLALLCLLTAAESGDAAIDEKATVILTPANASAGDEQLAADLARELQLGGFTVTRATTSTTDDDALRAELIKLAAEHHAAGGVRLSPTRSQISVEVWGQYGAVRKLRRRDFPAVSADERRVVALRAVELLRAVLLEVNLAAQAPQQPAEPFVMPPFIGEPPSPKVPAPKVTLDFVPEPVPAGPPPSTRAKAWRVGVGMVGKKFGNAQITPAATLSAGLLVADNWLAELALRADVMTATEEKDNAGVETQAFGSSLGIGPVWRPDPWELGFLVSGGVSAFVVRGQASAPLIASEATFVRPTATVNPRATYWFGEHVWARLGGQFGWVRPLDVYLGNFRAVEVGPLVYGCELALGVAWGG